uniref:DNA-directed RNA polymerase subunit alpha n=1 Tax=Zygnema circumcarinatum TaxID=35869 RepID=RPOA_ZYGCR|nr:alpha subunit of RNA polymerase [Zygnema circumcarinatum]Q32RM8.1 RecName: Full=DNA-directed RNA polymerase subunit alpha; Short=PEP; AltName: Full=Plastid-encoded RNA polymerase subunit alpha; Short=RNA polymerase subunit alpha [Zygnema circumcarinatum]AAX45861.1 alpha subunit of RNA polymerase [Zygnema circumcarinatum]
MNLHRISSEPKCKCLNHEIQNARLHYGRFAVYPLFPGQAITIGTAIRRALLGEVHSTCITSAYVVGASHEYSTLKGIRESIHDILLNLKDIVFKSDTLERQEGILLFNGPGIVTAQHIKLPPVVQVVDNTQYIARLEMPTSIEIHITLENTKTCTSLNTMPTTKGRFILDAALKPVRNMNYSIHSLGEGDMRQEMLVLEVWTNGSLTPQEVISQASQNLNDLLKPLLKVERYFQAKQNIHKKRMFTPTQSENLNMDQIEMIGGNKLIDQPLLPADSHLNSSLSLNIDNLVHLEGISIDDLQISVRASNCLKKVGIYTIRQLLSYTQQDLFQIKNLGKKSVEQIVIAIRKSYGHILG